MSWVGGCTTAGSRSARWFTKYALDGIDGEVFVNGAIPIIVTGLADLIVWEPGAGMRGVLAFDESFLFVPLLSLGGPKKVTNLKPRKTIEAIRTMVEFQGLIEH